LVFKTIALFSQKIGENLQKIVVITLTPGILVAVSLIDAHAGVLGLLATREARSQVLSYIFISGFEPTILCS
jgi:ribulose kinase